MDTSDAPAKICSRFAEQSGNIIHLSCEQGGLRATNIGFAVTDLARDWVISLDTDTLLDATFLFELNRDQGMRHEKHLAIGTTAFQASDDPSSWATF